VGLSEGQSKDVPGLPAEIGDLAYIAYFDQPVRHLGYIRLESRSHRNRQPIIQAWPYSGLNSLKVISDWALHILRHLSAG